jgi:hypothetical protein
VPGGAFFGSIEQCTANAAPLEEFQDVQVGDLGDVPVAEGRVVREPYQRDVAGKLPLVFGNEDGVRAVRLFPQVTMVLRDGLVPALRSKGGADAVGIGFGQGADERGFGHGHAG